MSSWSLISLNERGALIRDWAYAIRKWDDGTPLTKEEIDEVLRRDFRSVFSRSSDDLAFDLNWEDWESLGEKGPKFMRVRQRYAVRRLEEVREERVNEQLATVTKEEIFARGKKRKAEEWGEEFEVEMPKVAFSGAIFADDDEEEGTM